MALPLEPGLRVSVRFDGDDGYVHERLLSWEIAAGVWMIFTSDGHLYPESVSDWTHVYQLSGSAEYPDGITDVDTVLAFRSPLSDAELADGWRLGSAVPKGWWRHRHLSESSTGTACRCDLPLELRLLG